MWCDVINTYCGIVSCGFVAKPTSFMYYELNVHAIENTICPFFAWTRVTSCCLSLTRESGLAAGNQERRHKKNSTYSESSK